MSFTLEQLRSLCSILDDKEEVKRLISTAVQTYHIEQKKQLEWDTFKRAIELIRKTVDPLEILVTRPQIVCGYQGRNTEYQMRFWKKRYGHVNHSGDVSEGGGGCLLAEVYSDVKQDRYTGHRLSYPNHVSDFSSLFPGYCWVRRTELAKAGNTCGYEIDFFTLIKKE